MVYLLVKDSSQIELSLDVSSLEVMFFVDKHTGQYISTHGPRLCFNIHASSQQGPCTPALTDLVTQIQKWKKICILTKYIHLL